MCSQQFAALVVLTIIGLDKDLVQSQTMNSHGIKLSSYPNSEKFQPGHDVRFTCTHDMGLTGLGADSLGWSRRTGNLTMIISKAMLMAESFVGQNRYRISRSIDDEKKIATYSLIIVGLRLEDSGTINCYSWHANRGASKVLAVCAEPTTSTCDCILREGWATPVCYGGSKTTAELQASCDKTITGIGICFAIAIIYGVIITVLFAKDCLRVIRQKRKRKEMRLKMMEERGGKAPDPYADSEKLTLDPNEETASVPDSGVFEGSSSNNNSGRRQPPQPTQRPPYHENMARSRPVVRMQEHVNSAFNADEALVDQDPGANTIEERTEVYNTDYREKKAPERPPLPSVSMMKDQMTSGLRASREQLAAVSGHNDRVTNTPRDHSKYHDRSYDSITPESSRRPPRPRLPSALPPSSTQSEGRGTRPRIQETGHTGDNQRAAYTDVSKYDNIPQAQPRGHYTEPRRLDFVPQDSAGYHSNNLSHYGNNPTMGHQPSGPYIDDHDTEI